MTHPDHNARRYYDQYICPRCGKSWDIDEPEPPECKTSQDFIDELRKTHGLNKHKEE